MHIALRSAALALAVLAAPAVRAQAPPTDGGRFDIVTDNSGVVGIHLAILPDDKFFLSERFRELPNPWKRFINETSGVKPNPNYFNNTANDALADQAVASGFYVINPNAKIAGFLTDVAEYDLKKKTFELKRRIFDGDQGYAFCNAIAQMGDGSLLVAGGDSKFESPLGINGERITSDGRRDVRIYKNGALTKVAQMPYMDGPGNWKNYTGRWYPTAVTLANEDVMILGGQKIYYEPGSNLADNPTYEIFRTATSTLDKPVPVDILAKTFPVNMYPIAYVLPKTGHVWSLSGNLTSILNTETKTETPATSLPNDGIMHRSFPFSGTNWMNPLRPQDNYKTSVWICGGTDMTTAKQDLAKGGGVSPWYDNCSDCLATKKCYSIDPEEPNAQWKPEEMPLARSQPMAINLPDGKIAMFGGSGKGHQGGDAGYCMGTDPVNKVVLFNPSATKPEERWKVGAEAKVPRLYHAASVLRTDGSVLLSGSDCNNLLDPKVDPYELRMEVYQPPYFTATNRVQLDLATAPKAVRYGQQFIVPFATPDAGKTIASVSMIRFGSSTHTLNVDQRHVELKITDFGKDKLRVQAPPNSNIAPPGNWMLWAVDNRGIPVVEAAVVNLRASNPGEDAAWNQADTITPDAKSSAGGLPSGLAAGAVAALAGAAVLLA
ncbi:hypothetical protein DFS34DRAFT_599264 [Phlyctochytrium arcticum]|nr:hypothetical protein DFS34DRAFT_599264 [Phlyctochytrium arcticum]